jgi:hypothetical protein
MSSERNHHMHVIGIFESVNDGIQVEFLFVSAEDY